MKIHSQRPNLWHVIVTIIALIYVTYFTYSLLLNLYLACESQYRDAYAHPQVVITFFLGITLMIVLVEIYLIRDLIKQVSLFFRRKAK